jgi:hypothetical protein
MTTTKKAKKTTPDTLVTVTMTGRKGVYTIAHGNGKHSIEAWANTLADLTDYRPEYLIPLMVNTLKPGRLNMKIPTSAGDLCPIEFIVQKA